MSAQPKVRSAPVCLCADCLRVLPGFFNDNEVSDCSHCGGELCDCADCLHTIQLLKQGFRDAETLGLIADIRGWSATGGAR